MTNFKEAALLISTIILSLLSLNIITKKLDQEKEIRDQVYSDLNFYKKSLLYYAPIVEKKTVGINEEDDLIISLYIGIQELLDNIEIQQDLNKKKNLLEIGTFTIRSKTGKIQIFTLRQANEFIKLLIQKNPLFTLC